MARNGTPENAVGLSSDERPADKYVGKIMFDRYEVCRRVGCFGLRASYLVRDIRSHTEWLMLVYDKSCPPYDPEIKNRDLAEVYALKKFVHPAFPKIADIIENEEGVFIVSERISGDYLEVMVKAQGAQPAEKVIEWGKQLCSALGYLHSQTTPYIHGDVRPANVCLGPDGILKIVDFGLLRMYGPKPENDKPLADAACCGTVGYAAPEQFGGGTQVDARTDIYAFGKTLFRLVTGIDPSEPPYETMPICSIDPSLPRGLEYIILKCTRPNPEERYQSFQALAEGLEHYQSLPKPKGFFSRLFGKKK